MTLAKSERRRAAAGDNRRRALLCSTTTGTARLLTANGHTGRNEAGGSGGSGRGAARARGRVGAIDHIDADGLGELELADALEYLVPRLAQIVAVGVRNGDERLDALDVLGLHLGDGRGRGEQSEARQRLHVRVALQLQVEDARDADGTTHAVQAQVDHLVVVRVLFFYIIFNSNKMKELF